MVSVTEGDTCVCVQVLCGKKANGMTSPSLGRTMRTWSGKLDLPWPSERLPREKAEREKTDGMGNMKGHLSRERGSRTPITTELYYPESYLNDKMQFAKGPVVWVLKLCPTPFCGQCGPHQQSYITDFQNWKFWIFNSNSNCIECKNSPNFPLHPTISWLCTLSIESWALSSASLECRPGSDLL